jgi:Holliday junction resolvasome RuvABC DNA-binding subunit
MQRKAKKKVLFNILQWGDGFKVILINDDCTLQRKLVEKHQPVVIDCGGVGYHVNISLHTYSLLPKKLILIKIILPFQVKEDSHTLFGFIEKSGERNL